MQKVKMMKKYADLLAEEGLASGPKEDVAIYADVEMYGFVRYMVGELYKNRVKHVVVHYTDQSLLRQELINTPDTRIPWLIHDEEQGLEDEVNKHMSRLVLLGESYMTYKRMPNDKAKLYREARENSLGQLLDSYRKGDIVSCYAPVPTKSWAKALYPSLTPSQSYDRLWENIYGICQIEDEGNPALSYHKHIVELNRKAEVLNKYHFESLHMVSLATKTDLTVSLPIKHLWHTAYKEERKSGFKYLATIPAERVYTSPHSHGTNGVVHITQPVWIQGSKITGIWLKFDGGKVIAFGSDQGEESLKPIIQYDDFSFRLGEVSLVSKSLSLARLKDDPFGNCILDAASAVTIALGNSDPECFEDGINMDATELRSHGLNQSRLRFHLPIGSEDLTIVGETEEGKKTTVFKAGEWAF